MNKIKETYKDDSKSQFKNEDKSVTKVEISSFTKPVISYIILIYISYHLKVDQSSDEQNPQFKNPTFKRTIQSIISRKSGGNLSPN